MVEIVIRRARVIQDVTVWGSQLASDPLGWPGESSYFGTQAEIVLLELRWISAQAPVRDGALKRHNAFLASRALRSPRFHRRFRPATLHCLLCSLEPATEAPFGVRVYMFIDGRSGPEKPIPFTIHRL